MFKLALSPSYWTPAVFRFTGADGKPAEARFDCEFERLDEDQHTDLVRRARAGTLTDADVVRRVLRGWRDVVDAHDAELPYSAHARDRMLAVQGMADAIAAAYIGSRAGAPGKI